MTFSIKEVLSNNAWDFAYYANHGYFNDAIIPRAYDQVQGKTQETYYNSIRRVKPSYHGFGWLLDLYE